MSPWMINLPSSPPSMRCHGATAVVGVTSATGLPKRVIRIGWPVRRTFSSTARQVALNFEMGISSIGLTSRP